MDVDIENTKQEENLSKKDIMEIIGDAENLNPKVLKKRQLLESTEETTSSRASDNPPTTSLPRKIKKTKKGKKITEINSKNQSNGNIEESDNESNTEENYPTYSEKSRPPFFVYIKYSKNLQDKKDKALPILEIARRLVKLKINFKKIDRHTRNIWKITFDTAAQANAIIRNKEIKKEDFIAFIPRFKIFKKGVIKGIPEDIPDEEIIQVLKEDNPDIMINRIFRLKRKDRDTKRWINSQSICVEINGHSLPQNIKLWKAIIQVSIYIPQVRMCFRCGLMGHISKQCSAQQRCLNCSESHPIEKDKRCVKDKKCINCSGSHFTLYKFCPKFIQSMEINKTMAKDNISFIEAKKRVLALENVSQQRDIDKDFRNFPTLNNETLDTEVFKSKKWPNPLETEVQDRILPLSSKDLMKELENLPVNNLEQLCYIISRTMNKGLLIQRIIKTMKLHIESVTPQNKNIADGFTK